MFQKDVISLLDNFGIESVEDFYSLPMKDRSYFVVRLYKAFETGARETIRDLKVAGGVKFHFSTGGEIPARASGIHNSNFVKKLSFYANRTLVTFPFKEVKDLGRLIEGRQWTDYIDRKNQKPTMLFGDIHFTQQSTIAHSGKVYAIDKNGFDDFLLLIIKYRQALLYGAIQLLPVYPDTKKRIYSPSLGLLSSNFNLRSLRTQFIEFNHATNQPDRQYSGLSYLLLPHFSNVPLERILEIRDKESGMYAEMQRRLENMLYGSANTDSEQVLLSYMKEVDQGVREMHRKFESIQADYRRKNIYMLIKFVTAGLVLFTPASVAKAIGSVMGSISYFDYLKGKEESDKLTQDMKDNEFYLPWLIYQESNKA